MPSLHYAPGRGAVHALKFLEGYRGRFLQCDGYEVYDKLPEVGRPQGPWQVVNCWTHVRRRFVKRLQSDGSPIAEEALRQITQLYAIEASVRGLVPEIRLAARQDLSAPIVAGFRPWLEAQLSRIPQSSKLAEDIRYTLGRWPGLIRPSGPSSAFVRATGLERSLRDRLPKSRRRSAGTGHQPGRKSDPESGPHTQERTIRRP